MNKKDFTVTLSLYNSNCTQCNYAMFQFNTSSYDSTGSEGNQGHRLQTGHQGTCSKLLLIIIN